MYTMKTNLNHIGVYIKLYRLNKNLTQYQLSNMIGVAKTSVSMWECCRRIPNRQDFCKLCDVLNMPIDFFFPMYLKSK